MSPLTDLSEGPGHTHTHRQICTHWNIFSPGKKVQIHTFDCVHTVLKLRPHLQAQSCGQVWCYSAIVVISNDETRRAAAVCEWDSLCCSDEEGADHTSPSSLCEHSLYVCRLVGTWGHSSCLSVLPCPLTRVFTFDMCVGCRASRCVIMSGPRHGSTLLLLWGFVNGGLHHMEIPASKSLFSTVR